MAPSTVTRATSQLAVRYRPTISKITLSAPITM